MDIGVVGINHKISALDLREKVASGSYRFLLNRTFHYILLTTCNRTEIYFSGEDLSATHVKIIEGLRQEIDEDFEHELYSYFHGDCFRHLAQVTAGFDSAILAESDIQRQVKLAYQSAHLSQEVPAPLHFLFQKCLKIGKEIRSFYPMIRPQIALEQILFELSKIHFKEKKTIQLLMIGNSQINRKILAFLRHKKGLEISLCTRSPKRAEELGIKYGAQIKGWEELKRFSSYDFIISGSKSSDYLIKQAPPMDHFVLIADLSLPRTVDPKVGKHPQIQLYNIDELSQMVSAGRYQQQHTLFKAMHLIEENVAKQLSLYHQKTLECLCV